MYQFKREDVKNIVRKMKKKVLEFSDRIPNDLERKVPGPRHGPGVPAAAYDYRSPQPRTINMTIEDVDGGRLFSAGHTEHSACAEIDGRSIRTAPRGGGPEADRASAVFNYRRGQYEPMPANEVLNLGGNGRLFSPPQPAGGYFRAVANATAPGTSSAALRPHLQGPRPVYVPAGPE